MDVDQNSSLYQVGMSERRAVLGDEYVDASIAAAQGFAEPFQRLVTELCWGSVWARPGLDRRTRSLVNLGMLTALNRPEELQTHIRGALRNGCTQDEIVEVLLQAAVYCGMPAGVDAFRVAGRVFSSQNGAAAASDGRAGPSEAVS